MSVKIVMSVCAAIALAGCGGSSYERERQKLLSEYETRNKVLCSKEYDSDKQGDWEQVNNLFDLSTNMYSKALTWQGKHPHTAEEKTLVAEVNKFLESWIVDIDKKYQNASGSYSGIFNLQERMIFYNKGIYRLLMSPNEKRRWRRVENADWHMQGQLIKFSKGASCASLTWRLFEPSPYLKDYGWQIFIKENSVFSANGFDYAIVWFAGEGNLIGCPTTTEEQVFVEIKEGRIIRYVGLHNIIEPVSLLTNEHNQITIIAETGHFEKVKYVIDIKQMKIIKSQSMLSHDFIRDGYDKLFIE